MIGTYTKVSISCVAELEWDLGSWPAPVATEPKPEVATNGVNGTASKEDEDRAAVADEVADTAEKLDSNEAKPVAA